MNFERPGTETRAEQAARLIGREYGERFHDTAGLNLAEVGRRVLFDLDEAVGDETLPSGLRFAIVGRGDHLLVDVFGLDDDRIEEHGELVTDVVERIVAAYNYSNTLAAWDVRFDATVRLLTRYQQWQFRNAHGVVEVRHYPY